MEKFKHTSIKDQMEKFNLTEVEAKEKIDILKKKTATGHLVSNVECQMEKFNLTEDEAKEKINNAFAKRKESYIKLKETDEFRWRAIRPFNKEHWLNKGYDEVESIKKANEIAENNRQAFIRKMNNPEYAEKHFKKCVGYKNYEMPSGKIVKLQGYEPQVLDELLQTYDECDIIVGIKEIINSIGIIRYKFKNNEHRYYPDFYIKSTNTIIEVKSQWTFDKWREKNIAKQKACLMQGFNFKFMIYD